MEFRQAFQSDYDGADRGRQWDGQDIHVGFQHDAKLGDQIDADHRGVTPDCDIGQEGVVLGEGCIFDAFAFALVVVE